MTWSVQLKIEVDRLNRSAKLSIVVFPTRTVVIVCVHAVLGQTILPTIIATAAVQNLLGGDAAMAQSRRPEILADAAYEIFTRPSRETTGNFYIDDEVLAKAGVTDLSGYAYIPDASLQRDIFLDE